MQILHPFTGPVRPYLDRLAGPDLHHTGGGVLRHNEGIVKSVEGVYRDGKVELMEAIAEAEGSRVIVTWVQPSGSVDLREKGIDETHAADLRRRLATFAEDWDRPEMSVYDALPR